MIRLTLKVNGKPIYIATEGITAICENNNGGSEVYSGHDMSLVTESPVEVVRKVLEYRLAMERYKSLCHLESKDIAWAASEANKEKKRLQRLAGLEE